ncbi:MAG: GNAT family N-acetyltransferase [Clostridiales bacterium]|nr:GNAT family N-acetyltransferase [Clostridiales bacterium]
MTRIETKRLVIRDHILDDLKFMHKLMSGNDAMHYLHDLKTNSLQQTKNHLLENISQSTLADREKYYFAIIMKETKEYIGEIGFKVLSNNKSLLWARLGYFILPEFWGDGTTTEAANAVIDFIFNKTNITEIEAGCAKTNTASERIMQKVGMTKEREYTDTKMHDRLEYRLRKRDWTNLLQ